MERGRREPEFVPIPIAENLGIEEVAAVRPARSSIRSSRSPSRSAGSTSTAARPPTRSDISRRRRRSRSRPSDSVYAVGDWIGQKGIEGAYERLLAGVNGERRVIVDSHGREVSEANRLEATPGQNLFLTLDRKLQKVAEEYFRDRVGAVVAMDPETGEILALVSSPSYDPNWFTRRVTSAEWTDCSRTRTGRSRTGRSRTCTRRDRSSSRSWRTARSHWAWWIRTTRIFCPGHAAFYGREFQCHKKGGHGWVDLREAIKMSCDVYFYNLGRKLGIDRISEIATSFGFGKPTGVDLAFEKCGLVPSEEWALQARRPLVPERDDLGLDRAGAAARDLDAGRAGARRTDRGRPASDAAPLLLLAGAEDGARLALQRRSSERRSPISPEKLAIVKDGMWAVVNEAGGTAYGSRVAGRGDGRQDRNGAGRGPRDARSKRGRPVDGSRTTRGSRASGR